MPTSPGSAAAREALDDLDRFLRLVGQRPAERLPELLEVGRAADGPVREPVEEVVGQLRRAVQQRASVVHAGQGTRVR